MRKVKLLLLVTFLVIYGNSIAQQNPVFKVESNHLSIDLNVHDLGSSYYLEIINKSASDMEISVSIQVNTNCGKTINYSKKEQIAAYKKSVDGRHSGTIETNANCKGVALATLVSMSVNDLSKEQLGRQNNQNAAAANTYNSNSNGRNDYKSQTADQVQANQLYPNNKQISDIVERQNRVKALEQQQEQAKKETAQKYAAQLEENKKKTEVYKQQSDALVNSVIDLVNIFEEDAERKRVKAEKEREYKRREEQQERLLKESFEANINTRKNIIATFTHKNIPLSSVEKASKIYYFIYAYDTNAITNKKLAIYISNVFEIGKYEDGTWPYMNKIREEALALTIFDEVFHGYYYSFEDAEAMRKSFMHLLTRDKGVTINQISYNGKPFKANSEETIDFWQTKPIAKLKFEEAEMAYNADNYTEALLKLVESESVLGKANHLILYMKINIQHKRAQQLTDDDIYANDKPFYLFKSLKENCSLYLKDYGGIEILKDKYNEIYKISEIYKNTATDLEMYQSVINPLRAKKKKEEEDKLRSIEEDKLLDEKNRQIELESLLTSSWCLFIHKREFIEVKLGDPIQKIVDFTKKKYGKKRVAEKLYVKNFSSPIMDVRGKVHKIQIAYYPTNNNLDNSNLDCGECHVTLNGRISSKYIKGFRVIDGKVVGIDYDFKDHLTHKDGVVIEEFKNTFGLPFVENSDISWVYSGKYITTQVGPEMILLGSLAEDASKQKAIPNPDRTLTIYDCKIIEELTGISLF